jgi:hypothetical protein
MFDERAGDNAAPKLSGGLSLGPLSSRRIQVSVCGRARKTHLRFTYTVRDFRVSAQEKFSGDVMATALLLLAWHGIGARRSAASLLPQ